MTTQSDFKRRVRGRMQKTGESYNAARARLLSKRAPRASRADAPVTSKAAAVTVDPAAPPPAEFARIAGMADEALKAKTGCTWEKWVWALDQVNAQAWPHKEIATYVHEKYKVTGWWAQAVTVGYERIRGLRERGQRRSGAWEISKSVTVAAPVGKLFRAFSQPGRRREWLDGAKVVVRKATPNKTIRITWEDGSSVEGISSRRDARNQVTVQHTRLAAAGRRIG